MNFADYRLQRTLGPARFHAHQCVGPIAAGAASFSQLKRALGQTPSLYSTGDLVGSQPPVILALTGLGMGIRFSTEAECLGAYKFLRAIRVETCKLPLT